MRRSFSTLILTALVTLALALPGLAQGRLRLSTTTSTENSGLLKVLLPPFEAANNVKVDVIAVGTGKALKLGENGDVDVVFTHDPGLEDQFMAAGFGANREKVMHNDFVVVGPAADPAGLKAVKTAAEAFQRLAEGKASFISRGDESGTHQKEKALWKAAGIEPKGAWYVPAGQGMGEVLNMADEKRGYALTDRGTYIAYQSKIELPILFEGDPVLFNPYSIMAVNPAKHPHAQYDLAKKLVEFVVSREGQKLIAGYALHGQQLFFPDAIPNP
ncbi:MAG: substrate-binding domain-containing protein [Deferrisomatales bacterium]